MLYDWSRIVPHPMKAATSGLLWSDEEVCWAGTSGDGRLEDEREGRIYKRHCDVLAISGRASWMKGQQSKQRVQEALNGPRLI
jgi:hypothetical protein